MNKQMRQVRLRKRERERVRVEARSNDRGNQMKYTERMSIIAEIDGKDAQQ